jgi:glutamyl-tRNA synthetase
MVRGRFAPSPTGALHLGGLATALFAYASARKAQGRCVLRVEDLDGPRMVPGALAEQLDDLAWLGLRFDEGPDAGDYGPYVQSQRVELYQAVVTHLAERGRVYPCDCSRKELRAGQPDLPTVVAAPHLGEEGAPYVGTCRPRGNRPKDSFRRPPALRLVTSHEPTRYVDALRGELEEDVAELVGDFILCRGDGVFAYQLAVSVDDAAMAISEVVRGSDLRSSAARQAYLIRLLGGVPPSYLHVPVLVGADGAKLSKRDGGSSVRSYRDAGVAPERLIGVLAQAYGQPVANDCSLERLVSAFDPRLFPEEHVPLSRIREALS